MDFLKYAAVAVVAFLALSWLRRGGGAYGAFGTLPGNPGAGFVYPNYPGGLGFNVPSYAFRPNTGIYASYSGNGGDFSFGFDK